MHDHLPEKIRPLAERLAAFMDARVYPAEATFVAQQAALPSRWQIPPSSRS